MPDLREVLPELRTMLPDLKTMLPAKEIIILTFFLHVDVETLLEPAGLALVPAGDVDDALSVLLADVVEVPEEGNKNQLNPKAAILLIVIITSCLVSCFDAEAAAASPSSLLPFPSIKRFVN